MRITTLLCSTALVALSATTADAAHGWYLGVEAGWDAVEDNDIDFNTTRGFLTFDTPLNVDFDNGWAILATIGYNFGGHWRVEGEMGYRSDDIDRVRFIAQLPPSHALLVNHFHRQWWWWVA